MSDVSLPSLPSLSSAVTPPPPSGNLGQISADNQGVQQNAANVQKQAAPTIAQGSVDSSALPEVENTANITRQKLGSVIDAAMAKIAATHDTISDANDKILAAKASPLVSPFLALFGDTDSNVHYQKQRIQGAAADLESANQQVQTLSQAANNADNVLANTRQGAQLGINAAQSATSANATALNAAATLASSQSQLMDAQIRQQQAARQEAATQVNGMSDVDIQAGLDNPDLIAKKNPLITPGLLQHEQNSRAMFQTQLNNYKATYEATGYANTEAKMRVMHDQAMNLVQYMNPLDFDQYSKQATANGSVNLTTPDGTSVPVPGSIFTQVRQMRDEAAMKDADTMAQYNINTLKNPIKQQQASDGFANIAADPGTVSLIGPEKLNNIKTTMQVATALAGKSDPGSVAARASLLDDLNGQIQDLAKTMTASAPEAQRPALSQYHATGTISDPGAASAYIQSHIETNGQTPLGQVPLPGMDNTPLGLANPLRPADQLLRTAYENALQQQHAPLAGLLGQGGTGGTTTSANPTSILGAALVKSPLDKNDIFNKVLQTQGDTARGMVINNLQGSAIFNALHQLGTDYPTQPGLDFAKNLLPGGAVHPDYVTVAPDGTMQVDVRKLYSKVANDDIQNNTNNMALLIGKLNSQKFRQDFTNYVDKSYNSPLEAAYKEIMFKGDMAYHVFHSLVSDATATMNGTQAAVNNNNQTIQNQGQQFDFQTALPQQAPFGAADKTQLNAIGTSLAPTKPVMQPYQGPASGNQLLQFFKNKFSGGNQ